MFIPGLPERCIFKHKSFCSVRDERYLITFLKNKNKTKTFP